MDLERGSHGTLHGRDSANKTQATQSFRTPLVTGEIPVKRKMQLRNLPERYKTVGRRSGITDSLNE